MIAAPGVLYDSFGNLTPQGLQSFGFVRIDENGKVAILHALSSNEGVPITLIREPRTAISTASGARVTLRRPPTSSSS
jgi:hypothetical protein